MSVEVLNSERNLESVRQYDVTTVSQRRSLGKKAVGAVHNILKGIQPLPTQTFSSHGRHQPSQQYLDSLNK
jgi:hypothetical protein